MKKKKKLQSALFSPPGRWTGNNFLFKGGLTVALLYVSWPLVLFIWNNYRLIYTFSEPYTKNKNPNRHLRTTQFSRWCLPWTTTAVLTRPKRWTLSRILSTRWATTEPSVKRRPRWRAGTTSRGSGRRGRCWALVRDLPLTLKFPWPFLKFNMWHGPYWHATRP